MRSACIVFVAALCLFAQPSRDGYRNAFKEWRQSDPNLERDAASGGAQLESRARKVAADAERYEAARKAFLDQLAAETEHKFAWLDKAAPEAPSASNRGSQSFIAAESKAVQHSVDVLGNDPDPGIRRLRAMLLRESSALASLNGAISNREKSAAAVDAALANVQQARTRALDHYREVAVGWKDAAAQTDREAAAWGEYYKLLASGAQGASPAPSPAATSAAEPHLPATPGPVVAPKPAITPVPLIRYTGGWTFPASNGLYHGPQPESAELMVQEQNGHADGTLNARFKVASGDPVLRFVFTGEFKDTRTQVFSLETNDGSRGTLELIPGPAVNLLEINFQIADAKPGKIRQGNMLLLRK